MLGFALYFCAWHAPLHTGALLARLRGAGVGRPAVELARGVAGPWLATLALALGAAFVIRDGGASEAVVRVTFVGLAALTAPHALLSLLERRLAPRPGVASRELGARTLGAPASASR